MLKQISLYILGVVLLLFGNRKALELFLQNDATDDELNGEDEKLDIYKRFEIQRLKFNEQTNELNNPVPYFEIMRIDESDIGVRGAKGVARTAIETDDTENASDSL